MTEPRVLKNLLDSVEAKSVLYLDNKQWLDKALALFSGLDICWKGKASLSNGLLKKLLVVGSERRVSRHHLKDQTAQWPVVNLIGILMTKKHLRSNVVHGAANWPCHFRAKSWQAKISELCIAILINQNIVWLKVSVYGPEFLVKVLESQQYLSTVEFCSLFWESFHSF